MFSAPLMRRLTTRRNIASRRTMDSSYACQKSAESIRFMNEDDDSDVYPEADEDVELRERSSRKFHQLS